MADRDIDVPSSAGPIEYDVHGVVGIRLIDPSAADLQALDLWLGPFRKPLASAPDVTVRYVDTLQSEDLSYIEHGRTGFDSHYFYLLRDRSAVPRVRFPYDEVGGVCEIVCERGIGDVPFLMDAIRLRALARGFIPLHASAVVHDGVGVLMPAWAHGGKTTGLLALAAAGAEYVGDEWVLLSSDGSRMYGLPQAVPLHRWQVEQLGGVRGRVSAPKRTAAAAVRLIARAAEVGAGGIEAPGPFLQRAVAAADRRLDVHVDPVVLPGGVRPNAVADVHRVLFMIRRVVPGIVVERAQAAQVAVRAAAATAREHAAALTSYLAYRCAFPGRPNPWLEHVPQLLEESLIAALAGKETYLVHHPSPCSLLDLFAAMEPACRPMATIRA